MSEKGRHRPGVCRLALFLLLLLPLGSRGIEQLDLDFGDLQFGSWRLQQVRLHWQGIGERDQGYRVSVARLDGPGLPQPVSDMLLDCQQGVLDGSVIQCDKGRISAVTPWLRLTDNKIIYHLNYLSHNIDLKIIKLSGKGFSSNLSLVADNAGWRVSIEGKASDLGLAIRQLPLALPEPLPRLNTPADFNMTASGEADRVQQVSWKMNPRKLSFASEDGGIIGDALRIDWRGKAARSSKEWRGDQRLAVQAGEVLTPWGYLDAGTHPLSLNSRFSYQMPSARLSLSGLDLALAGLAAVQGDVMLGISPAPEIRSLQLATVSPVEISSLYQDILSPVLVETSWEKVKIDGKFGAKLDWRDGVLKALEFQLEDAGIAQDGEEGERLRIEGLAASASIKEGIGQANLGWRSGSLFGKLDLGTLGLALRFDGQRLTLIKPAVLPILDGRLQIEQLDFDRSSGAPGLDFKGYLEPISLTSLTQALDWPAMSGKLSAMIPRGRYRNGRLTISGASLIRAFDGSLVIRDLEVDDPLGDYPMLTASLTLKQLDLEQLTETFAFGRITGRLEGEVNNLRLEQWRPISFDAWLATPENDDSRHRISQRAVENLSNLGGSGVSGALSRGFMRFFNEFGYSRLGIRCRLEGQTCFMDGVEKAENGYYLVKGGGLPRVDIVGFNHRTDWDLLVSKLKEMTEGRTSVEIR